VRQDGWRRGRRSRGGNLDLHCSRGKEGGLRGEGARSMTCGVTLRGGILTSAGKRGLAARRHRALKKREGKG